MTTDETRDAANDRGPRIRTALGLSPVEPQSTRGSLLDNQEGRRGGHETLAVEPRVGEWWRTPDGILWRVDAITERTVKLSTSRSYGVMKASAHRVEFVWRSTREARHDA